MRVNAFEGHVTTKNPLCKLHVISTTRPRQLTCNYLNISVLIALERDHQDCCVEKCLKLTNVVLLGAK